MIVSAAAMRAAEESAFASGSSAADLMEVAGEGISNAVSQFFPKPGRFRAVFGKGHNGGDVLVAARHLAARGWFIETSGPFPVEQLTPLTRTHWLRLREVMSASGPRAAFPACLVVGDGLLGTGARGAPSGRVAEAIADVQKAREQEGGFVVAADLPSGLDPDLGTCSGSCVTADLTVTLGAPKAGLLADGALNFVGRLAVVELPGVAFSEGDPWRVTSPALLRQILRPRPFDCHKGLCGRIAVLAGSAEYPGAARIASAAAVRGGGGLVSLWVPEALAANLAGSCIPEVMIRPCDSLRDVLDASVDVIAIGPGLGRTRDRDVLAIVREAPVPVIVDADALNAVSTMPSVLRGTAGPRLLTPHPGEMERLFPQGNRTRRQWAEDFVGQYPGTALLLKGGRSIILEHGRPGYFNPTGNPGMATGGMGDALTGVTAALVGQYPGADPSELLAAAAWLCGRSAELAVFEAGLSPESLAATDVIACLGAAFQSLRRPASC
ncbi:MAG: NAD(P)H-hydrate dehydratase [Terrimicrobiaceae bacterium]